MTTFEFQWGSADKAVGKVFARKRKSTTPNVKPEVKPLAKPEIKTTKNEVDRPRKTTKIINLNVKNTKPVSKIRPIFQARGNKGSNKVEIISRPYQPKKAEDNVNEPEPGRFIKRKNKKDKLAAQAGTDGNDNKVISTVQNVKSTENVSHSLFSVRQKSIYVDTNMPGKSVVEKVFSGGRKFADLNIHKHLVSNLEKHKFATLTNVQEKAIPHLLSGKNVLIRSQTGSGKTLAYAVPIIEALLNINPKLKRSDGVQAIIIVPTRELALQTHELFTKINTFQWIVVSHLCGGENRKTEKDRLRKGVHILIGTPGRVLDHMLHTNAFKVDNVRCLVLDEADRLLDMNFKKDLVKMVDEIDKSKINSEYDPMAILKGKSTKQDSKEVSTSSEQSPLSNPSAKGRQTVLLSATLNKSVAELADFAMKDHIYVDTLEDFPSINPDHMVIPSTVKQEFLMTYAKHRLFTLCALLLAHVRHKVFVFMATGQMVDYHYELFTKYFVKMPTNRGKIKSGNVFLMDNDDFEDSDEEEEVAVNVEFFKLHGSMEQSERKQVFTAFRSAKNGILLCTDVAARGVDVPEADCIIQYSGPQSDEDYIHRVGRTGRAGKSGSAIIFLTHEEQDYIKKLQEHKVFLKKCESEKLLKQLCDLMEEPDEEKAATALQRRFETAVSKDADLHRMACFAYSSWARSYSGYPSKMREIFNSKTANLGHYVTSFALRETPSGVARFVRSKVTRVEPKRLNKKLATHSDDIPASTKAAQKRKIKSISLTTSEFSSGLEPTKKRKKK